MKVLSIWGPWAQLIAYGIKDVENRSWTTDCRGPVAIHCTKGNWTAEEAAEILDDCVERGLLSSTMAATINVRLEGDRGMVIGVVEIVGSGPSDGHASKWAVAGGQVLELEGARLVEPVAVRGAQGLRDLDEEIARQLGEDEGEPARGGYDLDIAELFGKRPRDETNEEIKAEKRKPIAGASIRVFAKEVIDRAKVEVYRHKPHGDLPLDEKLAARIVDGETNETIFETPSIGGLFDSAALANEFGEKWIKAQKDRHDRFSDLRFARRLTLPERLDEVDDAEAKINGQIGRMRKLAKECVDDVKTLRREARFPEVDITCIAGEFAIIDCPSISEGTAGRRWWGAQADGEIRGGDHGE